MGTVGVLGIVCICLYCLECDQVLYCDWSIPMPQVSLLRDVVIKVPVLNLAGVHHDVVVGGDIGGDAQTHVVVLSVLLLTGLGACLDQILEYHLVLNRSSNDSRPQNILQVQNQNREWQCKKITC